MGKEKEETAQQPLSFSWTPPLSSPLFLINIVHVVRLCLIMHDCYQQQHPLNEAPLNGNTIIPAEPQEERQDSFFTPSLPIVTHVQWEASMPPNV